MWGAGDGEGLDKETREEVFEGRGLGEEGDEETRDGNEGEVSMRFVHLGEEEKEGDEHLFKVNDANVVNLIEREDDVGKRIQKRW